VVAGPPEAGIPLVETFLGAQKGSASELTRDSIAVLGVPHEETKLSRRGAAAGPRAIREATSMFRFAVTEMAGGEVLDIDARRAYSWRSAPLLDLGDVDLGGELAENMRAIEDALAEITATGALPVTLGGDHFITYPVLSGVARSLGAAVSYLHVDMHLDLADSVPGYGKHASGTPVRRLLEDGVLAPELVAIVGVEGFQHRNEWQYGVDAGLEIVSAEALRGAGIGATLERLLEQRLGGAPGGVYVSLDIDVVSRTYAPGTGNAVGTSGLLPAELIALVDQIASWPLAGLDLVEVAPRLDPTGRTAALAASALIQALHPRLFEEVPF